jgi:hypothetical protein
MQEQRQVALHVGGNQEVFAYVFAALFAEAQGDGGI